MSNSSRIVIVSSMLLREGVVNLDNLNYEAGIPPAHSTRSNTPVGYADSKLMNALFAARLSAKLKEENSSTRVFCVSPGWCRTSLHRHTSLAWYQYPALIVLGAVFMKPASKVNFCTYIFFRVCCI